MRGTFHTKLAQDGRMVIPAPLRHRLGLKPGDTLVIDAENESVRVRSYDRVVQEAQDYFRPFASPDVSLVDELIAERRAEAAKEDAELAKLVQRPRR
jgi:AbrB family looped-hinge helix DNA binding protein